jgi:hypothetical protein
MNIFSAVLIVLATRLPAIDPNVRADVADAITIATELMQKDALYAIELAELACAESGLAPWVLDGRANDPVWRTSDIGKRTMRRVGDADSGYSIGAWQVHQYPGGPTKETLLNVYDAALYVASEWAVHPERWSPWKRVKQQAARWRGLYVLNEQHRESGVE